MLGTPLSDLEKAIHGVLIHMSKLRDSFENSEMVRRKFIPAQQPGPGMLEEGVIDTSEEIGDITYKDTTLAYSHDVFESILCEINIAFTSWKLSVGQYHITYGTASQLPLI